MEGGQQVLLASCPHGSAVGTVLEAAVPVIVELIPVDRLAQVRKFVHQSKGTLVKTRSHRVCVSIKALPPHAGLCSGGPNTSLATRGIKDFEALRYDIGDTVCYLNSCEYLMRGLIVQKMN